MRNFCDKHERYTSPEALTSRQHLMIQPPQYEAAIWKIFTRGPKKPTAKNFNMQKARFCRLHSDTNPRGFVKKCEEISRPAINTRQTRPCTTLLLCIIQPADGEMHFFILSKISSPIVVWCFLSRLRPIWRVSNTKSCGSTFDDYAEFKVTWAQRNRLRWHLGGNKNRFFLV